MSSQADEVARLKAELASQQQETASLEKKPKKEKRKKKKRKTTEDDEAAKLRAELEAVDATGSEDGEVVLALHAERLGEYDAAAPEFERSVAIDRCFAELSEAVLRDDPWRNCRRDSWRKCRRVAN